jgi:hypothetical protein
MINIPLSIDDSLVKDITGKSLSDLIKYGLLFKWTTRMLESIQSHLLDNQSVWSSVPNFFALFYLDENYDLMPLANQAYGNWADPIRLRIHHKTGCLQNLLLDI